MERPSPSTMSSRHSLSPPMSPNKPLPTAPGSIAQAVQTQTPQKHSKTNQTRLSSRNSSQTQPKLYKNPPEKATQVETMSAVPQAKPAKTPIRRSSFSERTRSLTRKLSFFKDRDEIDSTHDVPSSNDLSSQKLRAHQSSIPTSDAISTSSAGTRKASNSDKSHQSPPSDSQYQVHPAEPNSFSSPDAASSSSVEAVNADPSAELLHQSPVYVPSGSPTHKSPGRAQDTADRTTILFVGSHHGRQALSESWSYPSKVADTATAHAVRTLPLRSYHSSETLQETAFRPSSNQANVDFHPKRTTPFQNSPTEIHLPPSNPPSPPSPTSSVNESTPNLSNASLSAVVAPLQTGQESVSAMSDDGDTLRAVPITQVSPKSEQDEGPSLSPQPSATPPAVLKPTPDSGTTHPLPSAIATYNGAASSAPLIDFLLAHPTPTSTSRSQVPGTHSRGPSGHSTKSAMSALHHRQHSGPDGRRPHIIHPSISHEDIKALSKRENGSHNKMMSRRPPGWKRVFSNGLGGHKKSKSENHQIDKVLGLRAVGIDPPRTTGAGKDGVWISRKNFLKT